MFSIIMFSAALNLLSDVHVAIGELFIILENFIVDKTSEKVMHAHT